MAVWRHFESGALLWTHGGQTRARNQELGLHPALKNISMLSAEWEAWLPRQEQCAFKEDM